MQGCCGRFSRIPFGGYTQLPIIPYESLYIEDADQLESVDEFAHRMWPSDGNATFRNAVWTFAKHVKVLTQIIHRMILQSFGVEKYYDSQVESMVYGLRMSAYGVFKDQEGKIVMRSHVDHNMINNNIVSQHQVDGLEVQTRDGEWIHVPSATQNSFNVMVGEAFRARSNGRLRPPFHRVRITGNCSNQLHLKRYSMLFGLQPRENSIAEVPTELIDGAHRLRFRPYNYGEYIRFRFSGEPSRGEDTLEAFCGVEA